MPPRQAAAAGAGGSSKPKSRTASTAAGKSKAPKKKATGAVQSAGTGLSDLSDLDPFADSAEEAEEEQPRRQKSQQKQRQQPQPSKRRREPDVDVDDDDDDERGGEEEEEEDEEAPAKIPPDLLTRLLHEFFEKDGTRISRDANAAVARYVDVFVRETIARTAVEKESGFLEVSPCVFVCLAGWGGGARGDAGRSVNCSRGPPPPLYCFSMVWEA